MVLKPLKIKGRKFIYFWLAGDFYISLYISRLILRDSKVNDHVSTL
jgi:hypothetical protein